MNENIDLTKILKDCPMGWKFYSSVYGDVEFVEIYREPVLCIPRPQEDEWLGQEIYNSKHPILFWANGFEHRVSSGGEMIKGCGECTFFPSREQRDWSKFSAPWYKKYKLVIPKFKVGDMIRHKVTNKGDVYEISKVYDDSYGIAGYISLIKMEYQDLYELVPNKFDPKTLKPFDKVLVKCTSIYNSNLVWRVGLFSYFYVEDNSIRVYTLGSDDNSPNSYVIPYNDDTKHLVNTAEEAPEYYRYWEE